MAAKQQKADLYAQELDRARLRGAWSDDGLHFAGKAKNNSWSELLRKYSKHNPNQTIIPAVTGAEQQLRGALVAFYADEGYTDSSHDQDGASPGTGETLFPPNVPLNRQGNGWSGPRFEEQTVHLEDLVQKAGSHEAAVQGIVAIHAYALFAQGKDEEAVSLLHESRFLQTVNTDQMRPEEQGEQYQTALFLLGFVTYGMANERLHLEKPDAGYSPFAFAGYARAIELHEQVRGGRKASALPGLPEDEIERWAETALYRNALLSVRLGDVPLGINALRAYQAHVARWPADFRLPQRNVINRTYLRALNRAAELGNYPALPSAAEKSRDDWRSQAYQRAVVAAVASRVKIRDFDAERASKQGDARRSYVNGATSKSTTSRTVSERRPFPHRALPPASLAWTNEVQTVATTAAATVQRSSEFPRAGQVNVSALLLSDELVRGWQLSGELGEEHADDLVDSLYTLSKLTFHSQRISRHLFTVLTAAQAYHEAREALNLYVSIVEKAREGDAAGSAALVQESKLREKDQDREGQDSEDATDENKEAERPAEEDGEEKKRRAKKAGNGISNEAHEAGQRVLMDSDNDETFVNTILHGAHVLLKYLGDAVLADKLSKRALSLVPERRRHGSWQSAPESLFRAKALRIAGQSRAALASIAETTPDQIPTLQNEALALLKEAVEVDSQSSEAYFHLAYLQAQLREISQAIASARKAIELEPADVSSWHLLTLLVSAQKDHKAAFKLAEVALDEAEEDDEFDSQAAVSAPQNLVNGSSAGGGSAILNGLGPVAGPTESRGEASSVIRSRLLSVDFPPSSKERAEAVLQLMMTQNVLEEIVAGADVAIESQKDAFQFFHKQLNRHFPPTLGRTAIPSTTSSAAPQRLGSQSGLGLSGSSAARPTILQRAQSGSVVQGTGASAAVVPPGSAMALTQESVDGAAAATTTESRRNYNLSREIRLLGSLWLASAASFRRAGRAEDARMAIQEAEKVDPGRSDVWVQLALLSEKSNPQLAVNSLYKALACEAESVAGSVHLARLFLTNDRLSLNASSVVQADEGANVDVPGIASNGLPHSHGALLDGTRSRSIGADAAPRNASVGGTKSEFKTQAEAKTSDSAKDLTAISLAEGLLTSTTASTSGWDSAEAWLYLGQVHMRTNRRQRARECLRYALELEQTKTVRTLASAIPLIRL
ncbi:unnamed protein product [Parajaminaea phylloscopi]